MSKIIEGLYLGSVDDCTNTDWLYNNKISVIFNVAIELYCINIKFNDNKKITCISCPMYDSPNQSLMKCIYMAIPLIRRCIAENKNILVHCYAGISRSASIVIAFLMNYYKLSFINSYQYVKSKRNIINPNSGFIFQLKEYENEIMNIQ